MPENIKLIDNFELAGNLTVDGNFTSTGSGGVSGSVPVGCVIGWNSSYSIAGTTYTQATPLPANFVECNGQTISNALSILLNGCIMPFYNGTDEVGYTDVRYLAGYTSAVAPNTFYYGYLTHVHTAQTGVGIGSGTTYEGRPGNASVKPALNVPQSASITWVIRIY